MIEEIAGFKVIELIGKGGASSVYKCVDTISGNIVAIKHFDITKSLTAESEQNILRHWKQEVTLLTELAHPSIIHILGHGIDNDTPYIVLEFIERLREPTLGWKSVVSVMLQASKALEYAHSKGIIHRDIKPTNVLISGTFDSPRVKVSDFGIAMDIIDITNENTAKDMSGSCHYMSPEMIDGRDTGATTDLYGLGLVSYELLTGRKAFDGESPSQVFGSILIDEPTKPSVIDPTVPAFLDKIILRLLRKNPEDRYQSASELVSDLEGLMSSDFEGPLPTRMLLKFSNLAPSIGRETEMDIMKADLAQSLEGSLSCRIIASPVGMGKTRLLNELSSVAKAWGFKCVNFVCNKENIHNSFSVIAEITSKLESILRKRVKSNPEDELPIIPSALENPYDVEPQVEIWRIFCDMLNSTQVLKPLLILVDDIHFADVQSLEMIENLIQAESPMKVMFIFTANTEYISPKSNIARLCEKARSLGKLIKLFPLEKHQIKDIVSSTFGTEAIPDRLIEFLFSESSGTPLYLEELLRKLVSDGMIEACRNELILKPGNLEPPESLLKLQGISLSALNESTGELMRIAAVMGNGFSATLLAETAMRPLPEIERGIEDAINNIVLEASSANGIEIYSFKNDRLRKNLLASINQRILSSIHDQVARAIIKIHESNISEFVDEIAHHLLSGSKPASAVPYLLQSSRLHLERFNPGESFEQAAKALELAEPETDNAFEAHICLAQVHIQQLQATLAHEHAMKAVELADTLPLTTIANKARANTALAESLSLLGSFNEAIRVADKTLDQVRDTSNRIASRLEAIIASNASQIDTNAAEKRARKAIAYSEGFISEYVHTMTVLSQIQERKGELAEAAKTLEEAIEKGLEVDAKMPSLAQLELAKIQLFQQCLKRNGIANLKNAEESAKRCGNPGIITMCEIAKGQMYFYDGQFEESIRRFSICEKTVRENGSLPFLSLILYYLSRSALSMGDTAVANKKLIEAKEIQNRTGWTMLKSILALEIDISLASSDLMRAIQATKDYSAKSLRNNPEVEGEIRFGIASSKFEVVRKNHGSAYKLAAKSLEIANECGMLLPSINCLNQMADVVTKAINDGAKLGFLPIKIEEFSTTVLDEGFITAMQSGFRMPVINSSVARGRFLFAMSRIDSAKANELVDQAEAEFEKARLLAIESGNIRLASTIESEKFILSSGG